MNELEELLKQKKEIEEKIKALKNQGCINGVAKIDIEHYPTEKPDRHFLAIRYKTYSGNESWRSIYSACDRESVIKAIPGIIYDLHGLYEKAGGQS